MRLHIYVTQISPLLSIFFITLFRLLPVPAFAVVGLIGTTAACTAPEAPWTPRPYYDIYDEAVNLYYKPPRRPEQALALMDRACRLNSDGQDILCYNLGVLLELQAKPADRILAAYKRARRIRPHALYEGAIQRIAPDPTRYESQYLRSVSRMVVACRAGRSDQALAEFKRTLATKNTKPADAAPREVFSQPFFAECLADQAEFATLLAQQPSAGTTLEQQLIRARAHLDPFHSLWDVELNLRGLADGAGSENPATAEWHDFVQSARRGQGAAAALHLRAFFDVLDDLAREAMRKPEKNGPQSAAGVRQRVRAFKRAAAVLIQGDSYFHRVRRVPAIQAILRPILK